MDYVIGLLVGFAFPHNADTGARCRGKKCVISSCLGCLGDCLRLDSPTGSALVSSHGSFFFLLQSTEYRVQDKCMKRYFCSTNCELFSKSRRSDRQSLSLCDTRNVTGRVTKRASILHLCIWQLLCFPASRKAGICVLLSEPNAAKPSLRASDSGITASSGGEPTRTLLETKRPKQAPIPAGEVPFSRQTMAMGATAMLLWTRAPEQLSQIGRYSSPSF